MTAMADTRAPTRAGRTCTTGLALALITIVSGAVSAQTFGPYTWTFGGSPLGSGSISTEVLQVTGPNSPAGFCFGGTVDEHATWFETVSPYPALVSCDVHFQLFDPVEGYDYPVVLVDDIVVAECEGCYGWEYDLHFEFEVPAGSRLALGVWSVDCEYGAGFAEFTNLHVVPQAWHDLGGGIAPQLGWAMAGSVQGELLAQSVDGLPDLDGDGRGELVVGAPGASLGNVRVFSGAGGQLLLSIDGPDKLGQSVASAGDVNGDGIPELVAGANTSGLAPHNGLLSVHDALTGTLLFTHEGTLDSQLGISVDGAGDLDGDGLADVIAGAPKKGGHVDVLGGPGGTVLVVITKPQGLGPKMFGADVAGAGDVDGDGIPDILIGAPGENLEGAAGSAYVYSGSTGSQLLAIKGPAQGYASQVAPAGDIDGDGRLDLLVADPGYVGGSFAGRVEVRSGADGSVLLAFDGSAKAAIGSAIDGGRDVDLDGTPDIALVGIENDYSYAVLVHSGADGALLHELHVEASQNPNDPAPAVALTQDIDLDGASDVALGTGSDALKTGKLSLFDDLQAAGVPVLAGAGEVEADSSLLISLASAPAGACGLLLLGSSALKLPTKGGVLVPNPVFATPICVGADGSAVLAGRWPAGLPQWTSVWMQVWLPADDGVDGWLASNGLSVTQLGP